jgi:hypothetical protein
MLLTYLLTEQLINFIIIHLIIHQWLTNLVIEIIKIIN